MNENLEPEENVMSDLTPMQRDKSSFAWEVDGIMDRVQDVIDVLDWHHDDDIVVEIGGTVVSGINQPDTANPRWSLPFGERRYNTDAFIVIKNRTRDPFVPSQPTEWRKD